MPEEPKPPQPEYPIILVGEMHNGRGQVTDYAVIEAKPGTRIARCGRVYVIETNGMQRRVK